jgi:hypothetical protein
MGVYFDHALIHTNSAVYGARENLMIIPGPQGYLTSDLSPFKPGTNIQ